MKIGVLHTSSNNAEKLTEIAAAMYPDVKLINFTDEALWELVEEAGGKVTDRCHEIIAQDFNRLVEAGCDSLGLLCSLVKDGIDLVRPLVPAPISVYDDAAAQRAVEAAKDGETVAVIAMKKMPLPIAARAVEAAAAKAGKNIKVEQIVVERAADCLKETKSEEMADACFTCYLRENQDKYAAYIIPQVPLSRIMPGIRDMKTPVFDSMETLIDELVKTARAR